MEKALIKQALIKQTFFYFKSTYQTNLFLFFLKINFFSVVNSVCPLWGVLKFQTAPYMIQKNCMFKTEN